MHFAKVGTSLCRAQLDLQEASTEDAAHHRDQDQCGSVPTVSYGLCSWHPWGWQGPPAEGGSTGPPSVSAFHMLQYQTSHQNSQSQTTAQNPLQLGTPSKASCTHEKLASHQLGKPPYPVQHDEKEKAAKIETKNICRNKVMYQLTRKIRA